MNFTGASEHFSFPVYMRQDSWSGLGLGLSLSPHGRLEGESLIFCLSVYKCFTSVKFVPKYFILFSALVMHF